MIPIRDSIATNRLPPMVLGLVAINGLIFLYQSSLSMSDAFSFIREWAMVPRRYTDPVWGAANGLPATNPLPWLSNMFLHGGLAHIGFNMWSLYLFGCALEERFRGWRFLGFYLLCGLAASAAHVATNWSSDIPALGASGAIAGMIGAYALTFPRAVVTLALPIGPVPYVMQVPAIVFAGVWFLIQLAQGTSELLAPNMGGGIAWWAHIGGFVAGVAFVPVLRRLAPREPSGPWGQSH